MTVRRARAVKVDGLIPCSNWHARKAATDSAVAGSALAPRWHTRQVQIRKIGRVELPGALGLLFPGEAGRLRSRPLPETETPDGGGNGRQP
jgi:hypothetical protein